MAGLAALMTRKKRDRRRELEQLKEKLADPVAMAELTGKEHEEAMKAKAAHETIKKMLNGKELLHQKSQKSFDALSQVSYSGDKDEEDSGGEGANSYSAIYIGLILICIGVVITFVGLGEKGFKTVQLKMIGPILCIIGLSCIVIKVILCTFPQLRPSSCPLFRRQKLSGSGGGASLMEKGASGINNSDKLKQSRSNNSSIKSKSRSSSSKKGEEVMDSGGKDRGLVTPSPRVTLLHSSKVKPPPTGQPQTQPGQPSTNRPRSTIPNYIEASSDEDDFNPERKASSEMIIHKYEPYTTSTKRDTPTQLPPPVNSRTKDGKTNTPTPPQQKEEKKKDETDGDILILNPKGLFL